MTSQVFQPAQQFSAESSVPAIMGPAQMTLQVFQPAQQFSAESSVPAIMGPAQMTLQVFQPAQQFSAESSVPAIMGPAQMHGQVFQPALTVSSNTVPAQIFQPIQPDFPQTQPQNLQPNTSFSAETGSENPENQHDVEMESGYGQSDDDWNNWGEEISCKIECLHGRLLVQEGKNPEKTAENLVGEAENRLNRALAMSQGQTLNLVNEALGMHDGRMADHIAMVKREIQAELSATVNDLLLQFQQNGEMVQNLAQCQRHLLSVEMERQFAEKVKKVEDGVNTFFEAQVEGLRKNERDFSQKLSFLEKSVGEMHVVVQQVGEKEKQQEIAVNQVKSAVGELSSGLEGRFGIIFQQCKGLGETECAKFQAQAEKLKEFSQSLERESKALNDRLGRLENFLGRKDFPIEKVCDLINKSEETIRLEVQRELGLQTRKNLEVIISEMLQERLRLSEREGQFEKVRAEMENSMKQQVGVLLQQQSSELFKEQQERKKLQQKLDLFQAEFLVMKNQQAESAKSATVDLTKETREKSAGNPEIEEFDLFGYNDLPVIEKNPVEIEGYEYAEPGSHATHVRQVCARPVGAVPAGAGLVSSNAVATHQLMKNLVAPNFSGQPKDWSSFVRDWDQYFRMLVILQNGHMSDSLKLQLFAMTLDDTNQKELQFRLELNGKTSFEEEFDRLEGKYAGTQSECARKKWYDVNLVNQGKITVQEWRDFVINFRIAWRQ
eukprot:EG_transcript_4936